MASSSKFDNTIVHVLLIDEPVPVWRPVKARQINNDIYELSIQEIPLDEEWEFQPGAKVRIEVRGEEPEQYIIAVDEFKDIELS